MAWHNYPNENPKKAGTYLVELSDGEIRNLQWDYVWGWCGDFDDYDQPHFVYDWDCRWKEIDDDDDDDIILLDALFIGMDIPNEAHKLLNTIAVTDGMTDSELRAYEMGIENALRATQVLLEQDDHIVFHLAGHDCIEEFDLDDLIEIVEEKEGY